MAPAAFCLRRMESSDLDAVLSIEKASFARPWTRHAFARELELPQSRAWVAVHDQGIVACIVWWEVAGEFHLMDLAVAPRFRRHGVASLLLRRMIEEAEGRLATFVGLEVNAANEPALALYARHGFVESGRRKDYYGDGEDALLLERSPRAGEGG